MGSNWLPRDRQREREMWEYGRVNMREGKIKKSVCLLSWVHSERNKDDEGGGGNMREKTGGGE